MSKIINKDKREKYLACLRFIITDNQVMKVWGARELCNELNLYFAPQNRLTYRKFTMLKIYIVDYELFKNASRPRKYIFVPKKKFIKAKRWTRYKRY